MCLLYVIACVAVSALLLLRSVTTLGISDQNPLEIVVTYMESQRMRIIDLFKTWDTDNSQSLSRDEFKEGLKVKPDTHAAVFGVVWIYTV